MATVFRANAGEQPFELRKCGADLKAYERETESEKERERNRMLAERIEASREFVALVERNYGKAV